MQSKYKVGLLRLNLLAASGLLAWQAGSVAATPHALLLALASAWLAVTAVLLEFSHRRPAAIPWQLLPGLLLAALLLIAPGRHLTWLWAWALLLMLPQPRWMLLLNLTLATTTWWSLRDLAGLEQWGLAGVLLAGLIPLGLSRSLTLQAWRRGGRPRARLIPGMSLWPGSQLERDLAQERQRAEREGVHAELLLMRCSPRRLWQLAERLCRLVHRFENCYRIDRRTLAVLMTSRSAAQATERRTQLLSTLEPWVPIRAVPLSRLTSLQEECRALARQADRRLVAGAVTDD
ncbi:hypothetical protein [Halomonas cerina]|uniref:GGDEF domain-containing protein n=1 Tax=Halomonas cerina TaxID=447424 RepID=A0A839V9F9_9GAMM|nr:hypothetical protein [Halomonas cerina]MBB3189357.1 hypothetical protein [Halomonas cerina]